MASRLVPFAGVARRIHTSSRESPAESPVGVPPTRPYRAPCRDNPDWFSLDSHRRGSLDILAGRDHPYLGGWSSHFPVARWDCRRLARPRRRTRMTRRRHRRQPEVVADACPTAPTAAHVGTASASVRQVSPARRVTVVGNTHTCRGL